MSQRYEAIEGQTVQYWYEVPFAEGWTRGKTGLVSRVTEPTDFGSMKLKPGHLVVREFTKDGSPGRIYGAAFWNGTLPNGWLPLTVDYSNGGW